MVRDSDGAISANQDVGVRLSVVQGDPNGDPVYVETHSITTNSGGLGSLALGAGTPEANASLGSVNWSDGPFYLKSETDPDGGSNYTVIATSQILSVPYALHAENGFYNQIGDIAYGGIIFSVWKDSSGAEHGLVASLYDLETSEEWGALYETSDASSASDGSLNTGSTLAGEVCANFVYTDPVSGESFDDWYLPAVWELKTMSDKAMIINKALNNDDDNETEGFAENLSAGYWSSTEVGSTFSWFVQFISGIANTNFKDTPYRVRAVRKF
ncbi:MAG: DUF1566 domain-containing protein [Flavobacteriales bacterium]|nr:DUF1566 domain-containing protein [Flavobacteriales bacterium]